MSGVVQQMAGKRRYLVRFLDEGEKDMFSNHLTIVVISSEVGEDIEMKETEMINEVGEEFRQVDIIPEVGDEFEDGVENRQKEVGVELDPDEEDIEDVVLDDDRERHWCMVFYDNNVRVQGKKALNNANR